MSDLLQFAIARRTERAALFSSWMNGGKIEIYSDPRPESADDEVPALAIKLATATLLDPSGNVANGSWSIITPLPSIQCLANGVTVWARLSGGTTSAGTVADTSVGLTGSGCGVEVDNTSVVAGGLLVITGGGMIEG